MQLVNTPHGFGRIEGEWFVPMWTSAAEFYAGVEPTDGDRLASASVRLLAPSPSPQKIVCIGLNYREHVREAGQPMPDRPVLFPKFANSVSDPGAAVEIPRVVTQADYEAELGVVIGRTARAVPEADALEYVAGYVCLNDLSARDLQFETGQWTRGKAIDAFLPMGPWLVTPEDVGDPQRLGIRSWVNGELRQEANTSDMVFGVAELISYISQACSLVPGDVISTGTPFGIGMGFSPPRWLQPGDETVVEIEGLGRLVTVLT